MAIQEVATLVNTCSLPGVSILGVVVPHSLKWLRLENTDLPNKIAPSNEDNMSSDTHPGERSKWKIHIRNSV